MTVVVTFCFCPFPGLHILTCCNYISVTHRKSIYGCTIQYEVGNYKKLLDAKNNFTFLCKYVEVSWKFMSQL